MKILVDAVGCRRDGVTTYWTNLTRQWALDHPDDEIVVLRAANDEEWAIAGVEFRTIPVGAPDVVMRPLALTRALRRMARDWQPDAILAARPSTTVLRPGRPMAIVVHDLRHQLRPEQFSRSRRLIRRVSYNRSFAAADGIISISQRTLDDLHRLEPWLRTRPSVVVHHGSDHTTSWPTGRADRTLLAFGHHANKNVDLVLSAWKQVVEGSDPADLAILNVIGLNDERQKDLATKIDAAGLADHVRLSPFLDESDFHAAMAGSTAILYPSDFEGFGLPVIEAMRLGKPVVVSPDPAVQEVAQGHAFMMTGWDEDALVDAIRRALAATPEQIESARRHAEGFTWSSAVARTREFLTGLAQLV